MQAMRTRVNAFRADRFFAVWLIPVAIVVAISVADVGHDILSYIAAVAAALFAIVFHDTMKAELDYRELNEP